MHTIKRLKFYSEINDGLLNFDSLDYSIITGGFVHNTNKLSDVDIITIIPYATTDSLEKGMRFIKSHIDAQTNNGFKPDYLFPSDILTRQQIIDAVNGRALILDENKLKLKKFSEYEMENNLEADYRVWLYEMITHDFDIIKGDFDLLVNDTLTALKTIWLYTASLYNYKNEIPIEQVRQDMFSSAGLSYRLNEKQCRHLLLMLNKNNMGTLSNNGTLILNYDKINEQIENLKNNISKGFYAKHFIEWNTIRKVFKRD